MHKKSATRISIFLVSILSCLVLFSCAEPNNVNSTETENKNEGNNDETPSYYAMIGTWINPDDNSDTITISEDTVKLSITAAKKYESDFANEPYNEKIITAHPMNYEFIQELKTICIEEGITLSGVKKNETEYYTWLEKIDIEFTSRLDYFQKEPSLYFGTYQYIYLWLDNEELNVRCIRDFQNELNGKECKYIKKGSGSQTNPSDNIDIIGSYTISEANGSDFTFAQDSTWTYKYNSSTSEGTWSLADGELTITYSLGGYSNTAVFTVSVSGNTYTLKGKSGDTTTIISSAFKITNQTALEKGVVTLIKQ